MFVRRTCGAEGVRMKLITIVIVVFAISVIETSLVTNDTGPEDNHLEYEMSTAQGDSVIDVEEPEDSQANAGESDTDSEPINTFVDTSRRKGESSFSLYL